MRNVRAHTEGESCASKCLYGPLTNRSIQLNRLQDSFQANRFEYIGQSPKVFGVRCEKLDSRQALCLGDNAAVQLNWLNNCLNTEGFGQKFGPFFTARPHTRDIRTKADKHYGKALATSRTAQRNPESPSKVEGFFAAILRRCRFTHQM